MIEALKILATEKKVPNSIIRRANREFCPLFVEITKYVHKNIAHLKSINPQESSFFRITR